MTRSPSFLDALARPLIAAPMAGGPTTPALVAAAEAAGGMGFLSAGYQTAEQLAADIDTVRAAGTRLFGVNLFITPSDDARHSTSDAEIDTFRRALARMAEGAGLPGPGTPRFTDNDHQAKLDHLADNPVPVVSFTFGTPGAAVVRTLHDAGTQVAVMVTSGEDAATALDEGVDVLIAQGTEAGGHQSTFAIAADPGSASTPELVGAIRATWPEVPLVGTGGLHTSRSVHDVLGAGADAAQIGTMLLCVAEAGTSTAHRAGIWRHFEGPGNAPTAFTRAFSGRPARGVVNAFARETADAPAAYPYINEMTKPIRAGAASLDPREGSDYVALWCGDSLEGRYPSPGALEAVALADVFDDLVETP